MPNPIVATIAWLTLSAAAAAAAAPPEAGQPDTRSMIEALKPGPTRSYRNLLVRQKVADGDAATPSAAGAVALASTSDAAASAPLLDSASPSLALAIQFETNSAQVRAESGPVLGSLVAAMQSPELKSQRFVIEGHTDARGTADANQRLSQDRAEQVRLYLVALGVAPARLKAVGKGASQPVNGNDPQAAENRRVRVVTVE